MPCYRSIRLILRSKPNNSSLWHSNDSHQTHQISRTSLHNSSAGDQCCRHNCLSLTHPAGTHPPQHRTASTRAIAEAGTGTEGATTLSANAAVTESLTVQALIADALRTGIAGNQAAIHAANVMEEEIHAAVNAIFWIVIPR